MARKGPQPTSFAWTAGSGEQKPLEDGPGFVASLDRGLRILRAFEGDFNELTLAEVAQRSKLSAATARRFLRTLVALGYVGSDGKRFSLRLKALSIGYAFLQSVNSNERFLPYLKETAQRTGCNSSVAVLQGRDIVYVASAGTKRLVRFPAAVGVRFPAYATALGRVMLADRSEEELNRYFETESFRRFTELTEVDPARLRQMLAQVRENQYSIAHDELEMSLVSIAVPLHGPRGNVIAAMNCSSIGYHADSRTVLYSRLKILREFAAPIEQSLAISPEFERAVSSYLT